MYDEAIGMAAPGQISVLTTGGSGVRLDLSASMLVALVTPRVGLALAMPAPFVYNVLLCLMHILTSIWEAGCWVPSG